MCRRILTGLALVIAALPAALLAPERFPPPVAAAATTWDVRTRGIVADEQLLPNAFFPDPLTIRVGDTVRWTIEGGHTVTFLGGQSPRSALPLFVPGGPVPDGLVAGPGFFPIGPEGPASYGGGVANSGRLAAREDDAYALTFGRPGVFHYICLTHPGMDGTLTVLPEGAALPETPAQAEARGQAELEALLSDIRAGAQRVRLANAEAGGGARAHTVAAGVSNGSGGSALHFVPRELAVRRGDLVAWVVADPLEPHSVTFTSGAPAPDHIEMLPQPDGTAAFVQRPNVYRPVGGTTYTGQGYFNSGQLVGGARGLIAFVAQVDAPAGTYAYLCLIHPEMKATITVAE